MGELFLKVFHDAPLFLSTRISLFIGLPGLLVARHDFLIGLFADGIVFWPVIIIYLVLCEASHDFAKLRERFG